MFGLFLILTLWIMLLWIFVFTFYCEHILSSGVAGPYVISVFNFLKCYQNNFHNGSAIWGFPGGSDSKESACSAGDPGSIPGLGRFPWRREWLPTPVFLPGESHGQRSLLGSKSIGSQSRTWLSDSTHTHTPFYIPTVCDSSNLSMSSPTLTWLLLLFL